MENAETLRQLIDMATSMCQSATAKVWYQSRKDEPRDCLASVTCQIASELQAGAIPHPGCWLEKWTLSKGKTEI